MLFQRWKRTTQRWLTPVLVTLGLLAAMLVGTIQLATTAQAQGTYDNATIATDAISHAGENLGSVAGQCKAFVNAMVSAASGGTQSLGGYQDGYAQAGGVPVSSANATKGDIIQITPAGSVDKTVESLYDFSNKAKRLHTAIIVSNNGNDSFTVEDANFTSPYTVGQHTFDPFTWAQGSIVDIWRMGAAQATGSGGSTAVAAPSTSVSSVNGLSAAAKEGPSNTLYYYWQLSNGSWAGPIGVSAGGTAYSDPSMVVNPSTGLESVSVQGPSNTTYLYWQLGSGAWNGPIGVSGGGTDFASPSMVINPSNGLEDIAIEGPGNTIYYYWQLSSGAWNGPIGVSAGGTAYSSPSLTLDPSNGLATVAVQGPSNTLYYYWQLSNGSWAGPIGVSGGGTSFSAPSMGVNPTNGLRSLSVIGPANALWFYWQLSSGAWAGPLGLG